MTIYEIMVKMLEDMQATVTTLLKRETRLLKKLGLYLGDKGSITKEQLKTIVKEFGTAELLTDMKKSKEDMDYDWYEKVLKE